MEVKKMEIGALGFRAGEMEVQKNTRFSKDGTKTEDELVFIFRVDPDQNLDFRCVVCSGNETQFFFNVKK